MTDDLTVEDQDQNNLNAGPLAQSLTAMTTHLLDKNSNDEATLDNSSERDIYLTHNNNKNAQQQQKQQQQQNNGGEQFSPEEDADDDDIIPPTLESLMKKGQWSDGGEDDDSVPPPKIPSTTPKGLLSTWSAVGSNSNQNLNLQNQQNGQQGYTKPSPASSKLVQTEYTVTYQGSQIVPSTSAKPYTTAVSVEMKAEREDNRPLNTKINSLNKMQKPSINIPHHLLKKPYNGYLKGQKQPPKHVKPFLEDVAATIVSSDDTHDVYQIKPISDINNENEEFEKKTAGSGESDFDSFGQVKPKWPYHMPQKNINRLTTKRPAFSRLTQRPKNPYIRKTQAPILTLTTPTTTSTPQPPSTTVYYRSPASALFASLPITFTNLSFFDFLRSQLLPRLGLSIISFMTTTPILLSLLGAGASIGRRKRDLQQKIDTESQESWAGIFERVAKKWSELEKADLESESSYEKLESVKPTLQKRKKFVSKSSSKLKEKSKVSVGAM